MPRFHRPPSGRRQPRTTAKAIALGYTLAGKVARGEQHAVLMPVRLPLENRDGYRKRFAPEQRLAIRAYVGGSTLAHIVVTDAERIQLGHVDYGLVRELGYIRVDAFQEAWVAEHEPDFDGEPLERFQRRHAHREMWVIRFALDRTLPDRYMAQNSEEGYTESAARGLKDEPPALHEHEWDAHVGANLGRTHQEWLGLGRARKGRPHKHRRMVA
jgi:hypothetical protein